MEIIVETKDLKKTYSNDHKEEVQAALIVERQQWTLQRLASMPVARGQLLAGKILAITSFAFAVGSGLKNPDQASGLGLLLTLTLSLLGGAWWPMSISPRFLQIIGHVSPVAWAMDGFTALTYRGGTLVNIWLPLAVLAGMALVLFLITIPRFKYQVD